LAASSVTGHYLHAKDFWRFSGSTSEPKSFSCLGKFTFPDSHCDTTRCRGHKLLNQSLCWNAASLHHTVTAAARYDAASKIVLVLTGAFLDVLRARRCDAGDLVKAFARRFL
jgi:hypothetical protein